MLRHSSPSLLLFFFSPPTATTDIYTLSLHDALPILHSRDVDEALPPFVVSPPDLGPDKVRAADPPVCCSRSEEHTSELQSLRHLVCRLLLEKKKKKETTHHITTDTHDRDTTQQTARR